MSEEEKSKETDTVGGTPISQRTADPTIGDILGEVQEDLRSGTLELQSETIELEGNLLVDPNVLDEDTSASRERREEFEAGLAQNPGQVGQGAVIEGIIVQAGADNTELLVDIGGKAEGRLPVEDLKRAGELSLYKSGDKIEVAILKWGKDGADPLLSRTRAKQILSMGRVESAFSEQTAVEGTVRELRPEGVLVDLDGATGFCHKSQLFLSGKGSVKSLVGRRLSFLVTRLDKRNQKIGLSHRAYLERERDRTFEAFVKEHGEGDTIEAEVRNVTGFGVFLKLNDHLDGLVQRGDISWRTNPDKEMKAFVEGQKIRCKVLDINREEKKIRLGIKQTQSDPWEGIEEKCPPQSIVEGTVINIAPFGAFVEIVPGVEGLIHVSDLRWSRKRINPESIVKEGDRVRVAILEIDRENRKMSLSLKHAAADPWALASQNYSVGDKVTGLVAGISATGIFIDIGEGVEGFVRSEDIAWTGHPKNNLKKFHMGQEVTAKILGFDSEKRRVLMGFRQMEEDPFLKVARKYPEGALFEGPVARKISAGLFVNLMPGVDGFIPVSHLAERGFDDRLKQIREGDTIKAKVISVKPNQRKITLSVKEMEKEQQRNEMKQYMKNSGGGVSLGDIFKDQLENLKKGSS